MLTHVITELNKIFTLKFLLAWIFSQPETDVCHKHSIRMTVIAQKTMHFVSNVSIMFNIFNIYTLNSDVVLTPTNLLG